CSTRRRISAIAEDTVVPGGGRIGVCAERDTRELMLRGRVADEHGHAVDRVELTAVRTVVDGKVGAILAARLQRIPVILDGYPACVAGAVLQSINPQALDHCLVAQWDGSPAHARLLERLGHQALLGLSIFEGAGAAGALALQVVKAALACHAGMATYEQAGLTGPN
ncbi:MAG: nicotinate-nucleotide--dimethylbenzimidazole phosphoribosyltransferase, partial [Pseudomonadota bacterium]